MSAKETTPLTAAGGKWSSGLCSCFSDCTSCLTVCCLKPVALGQLSQKVLGYPCLFVTILLFSLCMLEDIFGFFDTAPHTMARVLYGTEPVQPDPYFARLLQPFALAFAAISSFAVCVVVATVRNTIRRRDKIEQGTVKDCGGCIKDGGCSPTRASAPRTHASSLIRTVPSTLQRCPGWHVGFCPLLYYAAPSLLGLRPLLSTQSLSCPVCRARAQARTSAAPSAALHAPFVR